MKRMSLAKQTRKRSSVPDLEATITYAPRPPPPPSPTPTGKKNFAHDLLEYSPKFTKGLSLMVRCSAVSPGNRSKTRIARLSVWCFPGPPMFSVFLRLT